VVGKVIKGLSAFHFPVAFPEVFLRKRAGFDVLLGNPPWQEATVEDHAFWARHFPGLRGLRQAELEKERERLRKARPDLEAELAREVEESARIRKALTSGAYPGMGTGDPDFYKAFAWRFWNLAVAASGRIGVVLRGRVGSAAPRKRGRRRGWPRNGRMPEPPPRPSGCWWSTSATRNCGASWGS
jgi:hypothetical protein